MRRVAQSRAPWVASMIVLMALLWAPAAYAVTAGVATVYKSDGSAPLNAGGSGTPYGLALPSGAKCPSDSAHPPYDHVFSYLVLQGTDPGKISYKTTVPSKGLGLIAGGGYYGAINTARDTGLIVNLPSNFTWTRLTPALLFANGATSAVWSAGIACADGTGATTAYWNVDIRFTAASSDPLGFHWAVVIPVHKSAGVPWAVVGPLLVAVALAMAAVVVNARNRQKRLIAASAHGPASPGGLVRDTK